MSFSPPPLCSSMIKEDQSRGTTSPTAVVDHTALWSLLSRVASQHAFYIVVGILLLGIIYPLEMIGMSHISGLLFTHLGKEKHKRPLRVLRKKSSHQKVFVYLLVFFVLFLSSEGLSSLRDWTDVYLLPSLGSTIRQETVRLCLSANEYHYEAVRSGELLSRLLRIPELCSTLYYLVFQQLFPYTVIWIACIAYIWYLDKPSGYVFAGVGLAINAMNVWICQYILERSYQRMQGEVVLMDHIEDLFLNSLTVVMNSRQQTMEMERLVQMEGTYRKTFQNELLQSCGLKVAIAVSVTGCLFGFVLFLFFRYQRGRMAAFAFVSILSLLIFLLRYLLSNGRRFLQAISTVGALRGHSVFLSSLFVLTSTDTTHVPSSPSCSFVLPRIRSLSAHRLCFSYDVSSPHPYVLRDFSFHVNEGEMIGVMGPCGSGKSTIFKILLGFLRSYEGELWINDSISYRDIPYHTIRSRCAVVPQSTGLFHRSLYDNIVYGLQESSRPSEEHIHATMRKFHMDSFFQTISLHESVGKGGGRLSGGQRQMVLLLRCYFRTEADIILLDEPTSALDHGTIQVMQTICREWRHQKRLVFCITHDPLFGRFCDRVYTLPSS